MKYILLICTALFFISCTQAEETAEKKKDEKVLSAEDKKWLEEYTKLEEESKRLKAESQALDKLEKTVNKLSNTLGVDK